MVVLIHKTLHELEALVHDTLITGAVILEQVGRCKRLKCHPHHIVASRGRRIATHDSVCELDSVWGATIVHLATRHDDRPWVGICSHLGVLVLGFEKLAGEVVLSSGRASIASHVTVR